MDKAINNGIHKPVKNRERSAARFFSGFGIISLLLAGASFSENNFLSGIWPVGFLGIFAGAASLVTIFILNKRAKKMDRLLSGEKLIARWIMTDDERKAFSDNLKVTSRGKNKIIMTLVTIFFVVITIPFLFFLERDEAGGFLLIMGSIWLIVLLFSRFMPEYYHFRNLGGDGQILIGSQYAYINGYFHNWDFPLSGIRSLKQIKEPFRGIMLKYYYTDRTWTNEHALYIPVPDSINIEELIGSIRKENPAV
ncbi:MAG: hypothetical protein RBT38_12465 [Bacteroidales bacterium]|jgi:phosphatidylglycerophosphate synthase|nr:hypothetical protein [Bacteroidales bacterium]